MKYIIATLPFIGLIWMHDAWRSFECPLMLSIATLICFIIKSKSNEQGKKKMD